MTPLNTPLRIETQGYRHVVYDNLNNRIADFELYATQQKQLFKELIRCANLHDEMKEMIKELHATVKDYKHHCDNRDLPSTDLDIQIEETNELLTKLTNEEG